jgi:hypothetical protein
MHRNASLHLAYGRNVTRRFAGRCAETAPEERKMNEKRREKSTKKEVTWSYKTAPI